MNYHINNLLKNYPDLKVVESEISSLIKLMIETYESGNKVIVTGNGGSAADAEHIVGELMKSFIKKRPIDDDLKESILKIDSKLGFDLMNQVEAPLEAIALTGQIALSTAFNNDVNSDYGFAQQLLAYGKKNDLFIGISTSGKAKNIYAANVMAKAKGLKTVLLTGSEESKSSKLVDLVIHAPSKETYRIQEYHLPIYHCLCLSVEEYFFK